MGVRTISMETLVHDSPMCEAEPTWVLRIGFPSSHQPYIHILGLHMWNYIKDLTPPHDVSGETPIRGTRVIYPFDRL